MRATWLDGLLANNIPPAGRLALTPMLNRQGKIIGDFTVGCLVDGARRRAVHDLRIGSRPSSTTSAGSASRWRRVASTRTARCSVRVCGTELTGLSIAGPNARAVLDELTDFDVSNDALPFLDFRETYVGSVPAMLGRVTFTGDLGYEIWCAAGYQQQLFDTLLGARRRRTACGLFGGRALDSMRLDKAWGSWGTEYRPIYDPYEANMGWMVKLGKDFIGRDAAAAAKAAGPGTHSW